jgi:hypothetical protein
MLLVICALLCLTGCGGNKGGTAGDQATDGTGGTGQTVGKESLPEVQDFSEHFSYAALEMDFAPERYDLPLLKDDLAPMDAAIRLALTADEQSFLLNHGFVVADFTLMPNCEDMSDAYKAIALNGIPIFVTSGSMLHTYHILFDDLLSSIEAQHLHHDIWNVARGLFDEAWALRDEADGDFKEAATRDAAFLAVGLELLKPHPSQLPSKPPGEAPGAPPNPKEFKPGDLDRYLFEVPAEIAGVVSKEIDLIADHAGQSESPLFIYIEDYSQYVPRGHYTASEKLKNYFRAMMWFGRMTMLIKGTSDVEPGRTCTTCEALISDYDSRIQTLGAAILSQAMARHGNLMRAWERTYKVTSFFVGFSDDLGPYEYIEAVDAVLGGKALPPSYSPEVHGNLMAKLAEYRSPRIYGGTGGCEILPPFTPEQAKECLAKTRGFRLMGQRFVPDSYILSKLVAPYTGAFRGGDLPFTAYTVPGVGTVRVFPRGLDVMAVMGSSRARAILDDLGDTDYADYDRAFAEVLAEVGDIEESEWNQNLYWNWLWTLRGFLSSFGVRYPGFMQSDAWKDRLLKVAVASWTELRHDTILYVKQSYTMALSAAPEPVAGRGYVEPVPELYNRLLSLTRMTRLGLESMELLSEADRRRLSRLEDVLDRLVGISLSELKGEPLTEAESQLLGRFGEVLEGVVAGVDKKSRKTTLVADVHTDGNSRMVLQEGVGYLDVILVAVGSGEGLSLAAGPELTYYEFKQPMSDRLTDEAWREMLNTAPPARPVWLP